MGVRLRELLYSRASLEPIIHDLNLYPDRVIRGEPIEAIEEMRKAIAFKAELDGDTYVISFTGSSHCRRRTSRNVWVIASSSEAERRREDKAKTLKEFLATESVLRSESDSSNRRTT